MFRHHFEIRAWSSYATTSGSSARCTWVAMIVDKTENDYSLFGQVQHEIACFQVFIALVTKAFSLREISMIVCICLKCFKFDFTNLSNWSLICLSSINTLMIRAIKLHQSRNPLLIQRDLWKHKNVYVSSWSLLQTTWPSKVNNHDAVIHYTYIETEM